MLETMAARGRLSEPMRHCLEKEAGLDSVEARRRTWALWRDRLAREGATDEVATEAERLLQHTTSPDRSLLALEGLASDQPSAARTALDVTLQNAGEWHLPGLRAQSLIRLGRAWAKLDPDQGPLRRAQGLLVLGVVGDELTEAMHACTPTHGDACATAIPFGAAPPLTASTDDLVPCTNAGHLWWQARWGNVFTTERDCTAFAAASLEGDARDAGARLAALLTLRHRERGEASMLLAFLREVLPGDAALAAAAWSVHIEHGDSAGAAAWAAGVR